MLNPPLGTFKALKIIKKWIRVEQFMASKVGGSRIQNNTPQLVLKHPKTSFYVAMLLLYFKDYM
jgi:hypothetical protein